MPSFGVGGCPVFKKPGGQGFPSFEGSVADVKYLKNLVVPSIVGALCFLVPSISQLLPSFEKRYWAACPVLKNKKQRDADRSK